MKINDNLSETEAKVLSESICSQLRAYGLNINPLVALKRNLMFNGKVNLSSRTILEACRIDAYSTLSPCVSLYGSAIGRYCTISSNVYMDLFGHGLHNIMTNNALNTNTVFDFATPHIKRGSVWLASNQGEFITPITLGHDVHIEPHVFVAKNGGKIGTGAIIKANTVVTKDVPPYAIVAMGPRGSQVVGSRFSDEIIADLISSCWWKYDLPALLSAGVDVPLYNVKAFLEFIKEAERLNLPRIAENWHYLMRNSKDKVILYDVTSDCQYLRLYPKMLTDDDIKLSRQELSRQERYQNERHALRVPGEFNGSAGITLTTMPESEKSYGN